MNRKIISVIMLVFVAFSATASDKTGTTSAQFLKIGVGARASGLGEAYVALSDDIEAINWNPAGLASLEFAQVTGSHILWFGDITEEYVAFAMPMEGLGTIGFNILYLNGGSFTAYSVDSGGNPVVGSTFNASDICIGLSYAGSSGKNVLFGATVKYISNSIETSKSSSIAFDAGLLFRDIVDSFSIGISLLNLGTGVNYGNELEKLPFNIKTGVSWRAAPELNLACDFDLPSDNDARIGIGFENCY